MQSLRDALTDVEQKRQDLVVYAESDEQARQILTQFSTKNVDVTTRSLPVDSPGFVILRDEDEAFSGAMGLDHFESMLSPDLRPPWALDPAEWAIVNDGFRFLENTLFSSFDRSHMLVAAREIEERAWRLGVGTLFVGFQRADAYEAQRSMYNRIVSETNLTVKIFIDEQWSAPTHEQIHVFDNAGDEIGKYWILIYDGGESDLQKCGLLAEERKPGEYFGFWTYDPERVDAIITYLEREYEV